ncbi:MAG: hypothetical protein AB7O37_19520 [Vicinamibacteria bacterium]
MVALEAFEVKDGYAVFRPAGPTTVEQLLVMLEQAMKACQDAGVARLLVNVSRLRHPDLTTSDRFHLGDRMAAFWDRRIRLAVVPREDQIDPERFGAFVAQNRGLRVGPHADEAAALSWLMSDSER